MKKRISQIEIAKRLGVTQATVSNVLKGTGSVGEETKKKVLKMARDNGYMFSSSAQSLQSGRFNSFAVVWMLESRHSFFSTAMLSGAIGSAKSIDCSIMVEQFSYDQVFGDFNALASIFSKLRVDGLLINYSDSVPDDYLKMAQHYQVPYVLTNCVHPSNCVYPDDHRLGESAAQYLLDNEVQSVVYMSHAISERTHYSTSYRRDGFISYASKNSVPCEAIELSGSLFSSEEKRYLTKKLEESASSPDRRVGIFTYSIDQADQIYQISRDLKLEPNQDFYLISCSSDWNDSYRSNSLTTIQVPFNQVGWDGVQMLNAIVNGQKTEQSPIAVPPEYILVDREAIKIVEHK